MGQTTVHEVEGDNHVHKGVTVILPRPPKDIQKPCYAGMHTLNGNGEVTGSYQIKEWGWTNTVCLPKCRLRSCLLSSSFFGLYSSPVLTAIVHPPSSFRSSYSALVLTYSSAPRSHQLPLTWHHLRRFMDLDPQACPFSQTRRLASLPKIRYTRCWRDLRLVVERHRAHADNEGACL